MESTRKRNRKRTKLLRMSGTWKQKGGGGWKETEQVKRNGHKTKEKGTKKGTGKQTTTNI